MQKANKGERGFALIYILVLMAALFALVATASSLLYAAQKQNSKDKQELAAKADALSLR